MICYIFNVLTYCKLVDKLQFEVSAQYGKDGIDHENRKIKVSTNAIFFTPRNNAVFKGASWTVSEHRFHMIATHSRPITCKLNTYLRLGYFVGCCLKHTFNVAWWWWWYMNPIITGEKVTDGNILIGDTMTEICIPVFCTHKCIAQYHKHIVAIRRFVRFVGTPVYLIEYMSM